MAEKKPYFDPVDLNIDFPEMERKLLKKWYESGIVKKYLHKNDSSKDYFSFMDGPITANNPMGVHHAWGRTYKDLWQRYKNMRGLRQRFQNGFDCQGLWVEVEVEKELLFKNKKDIEIYGIANFVNKCKERVLKYSAIQTQQTIRLGNFMDWEHSYFTMSDENNYMIWQMLKVCYDRGWIYKGHESIPWCPRCETAISQHEMLTEDYKEVTHKAIYFALPIIDRINEHLLVWTTTPWTLPANIAVAVDKNLDYVLVQGENERKYWVVKGKENLVSDNPKILKEVKGKDLVGLKYLGMFDNLAKVKKVAKANPDKFHTVVATDDLIMPISTTEGTGLVHTAVSAGTEDFMLGKKLGLPMIPVIEDNADYMADLGFLAGLNAKKHPEVILDYLVTQTQKGKSWVFKIENYTHRYPACWRCKTELVWKVADEWYIAMDRKDPTDKEKRTLREQLIDSTKKVEWLPKFGLERELDWLFNMHDWLISKKNRYWGLALPIYECNKCKFIEVIGSKEELNKKAVVGWDKFEGNSPHRPWIDEVKIKCSKCGELVSRILDVGNPWLDAGIVPFSTISKDNGNLPMYNQNRLEWLKWFPVDFITESFPGQFKNWFYSMLVMGTILEKTNSFKSVLGFGTMFDEKGKPFHKSAGNAIEFVEAADRFGADIIRWACSLTNPADNLLFGEDKVKEVKRRFFLKLWNIYNYLVTYANLEGGYTSGLPETLLDKWIIVRLNQTVVAVTVSLDKYDGFTATSEIEKFVDDLSNWYVRRSRDRDEDRSKFLSTLHFVLVTLSKLIAPFTPFIADIIYTNLTKKDSVHLTNWPKIIDHKFVDKDLLEQMDRARLVAEKIHALRKETQIPVRQPLNKASIDASLAVKDTDILNILKDEVNIKNINWVKNGKSEIDTTITAELKAEGEARSIVRRIQEERKNIGTRLNEKIDVYIESWPAEFEDYIKRKTFINKISQGNFRVTRL